MSVGGTAHFNCSYTVTTGPPEHYPEGKPVLPIWAIGNSNYAKSYILAWPFEDHLPDRHSYSNQILTVSNVQLSDSGKAYLCTFDNPSGGTGTLTVLPPQDGK